MELVAFDLINMHDLPGKNSEKELGQWQRQKIEREYFRHGSVNVGNRWVWVEFSDTIN